MQYPLQIKFKLATLGNRFSVVDATGAPILFVKQKMFKLKEDIEIYRDQSKSELLFRLKADRIIDFSPIYNLLDAHGNKYAQIKRNGGKSIFKADYDLSFGEHSAGKVREENGWVKVLDALLGEIPLLGIFSGYFFNPSYLLYAPDGSTLAIIKKQPSLVESSFTIESDRLNQMDDSSKYAYSLLMMTVVLLERFRG